MSAVAIGVDAGGTFVKLAAVSISGRFIKEAQVPSLPRLGPAAFVARVAREVRSWNLRPSALGLALAGDVDSDKGTLRFTPNLKGWGGFPYRAAFTRALGVRAVVENDANAAVWGAYRRLQLRSSRVVGVTLGTGVGGGLIVEGKLYRGATGSAGEVGHTVVEPGGRLCHCGARGCLEAYCGSYGILNTARELIKRPSPGLKRLCPDIAELSPAILSAAAHAGDKGARAVWERTGTWLGRGLVNLILTLNPEVVLLLGGVSRAGELLSKPVRRVLDAQPFKTPFKKLAVRLTADPTAGCLGAALLALEARG